jgi:hypothetical protein
LRHSTDSCPERRRAAASDTAAHTELVWLAYFARSLLLMNPIAVDCAGPRLSALVL